jgi:hypothetical protein
MRNSIFHFRLLGPDAPSFVMGLGGVATTDQEAGERQTNLPLLFSCFNPIIGFSP